MYFSSEEELQSLTGQNINVVGLKKKKKKKVPHANIYRFTELFNSQVCMLKCLIKQNMRASIHRCLIASVKSMV